MQSSPPKKSRTGLSISPDLHRRARAEKGVVNFSAYVSHLILDDLARGAPGTGSVPLPAETARQLRLLAASPRCPEFVRLRLEAAIGVATAAEIESAIAVAEIGAQYGLPPARASPRTEPPRSNEEIA